MGIIRTDAWLQKEMDDPVHLCKKLLPYFKEEKERDIYNQLKSFGMYRPSKGARNSYESMVKQKAWEKVETYFQKYKKKWSGPDVPIFIFPLEQSGGLFAVEKKNKGGVSYPDKMFLFFSQLENEKEMEAVFVHEYHHVCRLSRMKKSMSECSLLDSIVIEGLAEYAVLKNCGKEYLAPWCNMYTDKELITLWNRHVLENLQLKKKDRAHDQFLFGGRGTPKLAGYALGFALVEEYYKDHFFSETASFSQPSKIYFEAQKKFRKESLLE